jgi:hypothetical protein
MRSNGGSNGSSGGGTGGAGAGKGNGHAAGENQRNREAIENIETLADGPVSEITSSDLKGLPPARASSEMLPARSGEGHAVYAHQEVLQWAEDPATPIELRKVYTRRVQELMAHGSPTRKKGVKGKNAGWLRTPLGGNGGHQFYLWFLNYGETVRRQQDEARALFAGATPNSRFLRAVRHHDATKDALDVGQFDDYVRVFPSDALLATANGFVSPLTDAQREAVEDRARVRLLRGRPGAGKTATLQYAASKLKGSALYVTWSDELARRAREHFDKFAPEELDIKVWTFRELLAHLDPSRPLPPQPPLHEAAAELRKHVEPVLANGPWRYRGELRAEELYSEIYAHLIGAALPVRFQGRCVSDTASLSQTDYRDLRKKIDSKALDDVLRAHRTLVDRGVIQQLFADPVAAFERARALQRGELKLPETFSFDWVLVDEVQDLTLVEQWLLVDVTARSGRARGVKPGMIIAGDESQTVRPTAFEFGPLSTMIDLRLGARGERTDHQLVHNLRAPEPIASLVDRAADVLYRLLPRGERPRGRRSEGPADVTVGRVVRLELERPDDLKQVLETFKALAGDASLVYPAGVIPSDVKALADDVRVTVWTSETIKGLEFRSIGVLDVPRTFRRIEELAKEPTESELAREFARTSIDRLLVALSRASEALVLIGWKSDWANAARTLHATLDMFEEAHLTEGSDGREGYIVCDDASSLAELLDIDAADAVSRIEKLCEASETLLNRGQYADALREAEQARGLLGRPGRPGAADKDLRQRVHRSLARAQFACALSEAKTAQLRKAAHAFRASGETDHESFTRALVGALEKSIEEKDACERLREVARDLPRFAGDDAQLADLVVEALRSKTDAIEKGSLPSQPAGRAALVEALDLLAKTAPHDRVEFRKTHQRVLFLVLESIAEKTDKPHREEYARLRPGLADDQQGTLLDARHKEACGEFREAADAWESVGRMQDALRCARRLGDFELAERLARAAHDNAAAVLSWAKEVAALFDNGPKGTLTREEAQTLRSKFDAALGALSTEPPRERPSKRRR